MHHFTFPGCFEHFHHRLYLYDRSRLVLFEFGLHLYWSVIFMSVFFLVWLTLIYWLIIFMSICFSFRPHLYPSIIFMSILFEFRTAPISIYHFQVSLIWVLGRTYIDQLFSCQLSLSFRPHQYQSVTFTFIYESIWLWVAPLFSFDESSYVKSILLSLHVVVLWAYCVMC